jgi:hypothetical protein
MTERESDSLDQLLRDLPVPEPSPDFLAGARRRYGQAVAARARREVVTSLAAALLGLALLVGLQAVAFDADTMIAWLAEVAADATRWIAGAVILCSLVPFMFWILTGLGSLVSLALLARARPAAATK